MSRKREHSRGWSASKSQTIGEDQGVGEDREEATSAQNNVSAVLRVLPSGESTLLDGLDLLFVTNQGKPAFAQSPRVKAIRRAKETAVASSSTITSSHPSTATRRSPTYNLQQIAEFKATRLIEFNKRLMDRLKIVSYTPQVEGLVDQSAIGNTEIEEGDDESDGDEHVVSGSGIETTCILNAMNNTIKIKSFFEFN
ncbi:hypothetical protein BDQ12DRAFT_729326 [Crucibulum laeve]|uniref:Uncharacterized protein n=1 Tax=Crucibulum laeve TaxID=68775 RepID=A0A5C3LIH5_9AGAR|nr:hypothetical protein BDQ12DRAFT_729326 [Crucibulum laeve]